MPAPDFSHLRVAFIHYWLVGMRGGEKVLEAFSSLFPQADIFTHLCLPEKISPQLRAHRIICSSISKLPFSSKHYSLYLPLMPMALEAFDLRGYDLIISSESGPAKGVICPPESLHICYCHSPMRYLWDAYHDYAPSMGKLKCFLAAPFLHYLRLWDQSSAQRVDHFLANSAFVQKRIQKFYRRDATIIHPPVRAFPYSPSDKREDFYLFVAELVPYKQAALAIEACEALGRPLKIVGRGPEEKKLKKMAGSKIEFLGYLSEAELQSYYSRAKALLFPGLEDFGISPLEAVSTGCPVLAYGRGGALETLCEGVALFMKEQSSSALVELIQTFEKEGLSIDEERARSHLQAFSPALFREKIQNFLLEKL